ncbi:MAG TPA: murein L,D-transpeptidase family protein [Xanthobacteraceae bacterium]
MNRASLFRALIASAALSGALALGGCFSEEGYELPTKAMKELSPHMIGLLDQKHMPKESPILVRLFKEESELEVWKQDTSGRYQILKVYPICRWSGDLGPKVQEGDRQAPEGFYSITPGLMNPNSNYYLAINTGFPNAYDRANGRNGALLMIHGDCSSRGCYAMTDEQIGEIYSLAREAFLGGQPSFQIQAYPFRMTPENLARHRTNPNMAFWKMLKEGNDHFETSHLEPKVEVCDRHYVFDPAQPPKSSKPLAFNPSGHCPAYVVAAEIAAPALEKSRADEARYATLVRANVSVAPIRTGLDGGMNRVFLSQVGGSLPPARVPNSLPPQPAPAAFALDNSGSSPSIASRLFSGVFGGKSDGATQVAATDSGAQEREATGTAGGQKSKLQLRETIGATSSKSKAHEPRSEPSKPEEQQTAKAQPAPAPAPAPTAPRQEANAAAARPATVNGAQPPLASGDFSNRWGGLQ